jgi:hypothetical protein
MVSVLNGTVLIGLLKINDNEIGVTMSRLPDEFVYSYNLFSLLDIASYVISQIPLCLGGRRDRTHECYCRCELSQLAFRHASHRPTIPVLYISFQN